MRSLALEEVVRSLALAEVVAPEEVVRSLALEEVVSQDHEWVLLYLAQGLLVGMLLLGKRVEWQMSRSPWLNGAYQHVEQ